MSNTLSTHQTTLLSIVANELFDAKIQYDKNVDFKLLVKEARQQAVDLFVQLDKLNGVPEQALIKHEQLKLSVINHNLNVEFEHDYLNNVMQQNNIEYCILKGCASQFYYPKKWLRSMGDVDFYVRKKDLDKTASIFLEKGFTKYLEEHESHIVLKKDKTHLEMHFNVAGMPNGYAGEKIKEYLSDIFEKSEIVEQDKVKYVKPSHFHHGIIITLHTYHHMLSEGIGLRHLCDLAVFFNSFTNQQFIEIFEKKFKEVGLWKFVQTLACVCYQYLALPYREWFGKMDDKLALDLICDVFNGGNFGIKDGTRTKQGLAISDRGKSGVKEKGKFKTLISNVNKITCSKWPFYKKVVILRPFGWLFLAISYGFKVIFGKRKGFNAIKVINQADKRKAIYKQFQLFEREENKNGN